MADSLNPPPLNNDDEEDLTKDEEDEEDSEDLFVSAYQVCNCVFTRRSNLQR